MHRPQRQGTSSIVKDTLLDTQDVNDKLRGRRWRGPAYYLVAGLVATGILSTALMWIQIEDRQSGALPDATENRTFLNSNEQEKIRWDKAIRTQVTNYTTQAMDGYFYLKLLLRATTGGLNEKLPEPWTLPGGGRGNGGCSENKCLITWDGWARSIATGDVLLDVIKRGVPGAVAEVGVYKGGLAAYLQGILLLTGEALKGREMWLIDSFKGLPPEDMMRSENDPSNNTFNSAKDQERWAGQLSVGVMTVRDNLDRLGLMDAGNVHFLEGYVQDSLPTWNVTELAFLRIDVDIYSATYDALHFLYPKLAVGGAVLFDDWKFPYSREAVINYRNQHGITTPVQFLEGCVDPMAYWIKE